MTFGTTETSQIVMVPILVDDSLERIEQFTAVLSLPAGQIGVVLGADLSTVDITDDDSKCVSLTYSFACMNIFSLWL